MECSRGKERGVGGPVAIRCTLPRWLIVVYREGEDVVWTEAQEGEMDLTND